MAVAEEDPFGIPSGEDGAAERAAIETGIDTGRRRIAAIPMLATLKAPRQARQKRKAGTTAATKAENSLRPHRNR